MDANGYAIGVPKLKKIATVMLRKRNGQIVQRFVGYTDGTHAIEEFASGLGDRNIVQQIVSGKLKAQVL